MGILIMIGQIMLSLMILVILHELGHFIPARWFNTRVEKFYLFFDPWFSLAKKKIGDTEYGIGWLPLGGYVKISGMVDESMDIEQMKEPAKPWEFRSKTAWQRLVIMLGGVTVNFILGFFLYSMVLFVWGEKYLPASEVKNGIYVDSLGIQLGLRDGDKILKIGDKPFDKFNDRMLVKEIVINNLNKITVERDGQQLDLNVTPDKVGILASSKNSRSELFGARIPFIISTVAKESPAFKAGIQKDDKIISINGTSIAYFHEFKKIINNLANKPVSIQLLRNSDTLNVNLTTTEQKMIGVAPYPPDHYFKFETQKYSLVSAFPAGIKKGTSFLGDQFKAFGQMFKGKIKASESLGGFGSIGSMFGDVWIWERFWTMTAILSLILAVMNLLPIPALDGGYVVFLIYEIISGKKPSDKFVEKAVTVGFFLLLALMVYANGLDIFRKFFQK
jgi:regulator of sigma E protease